MIYKNDIYFGGKWLSEFGGFITDAPKFEVAERDCEVIEIPGRSGDIILDNHRYKNVPFERNVAFRKMLGQTQREQIDCVIDWLAYLQSDYYEFRDTFHPGLVTKAKLTNLGALLRESLRLSSLPLQFSRVPYWYDDSGQIEQVVDLSGGGTITATFENPNKLTAKPIYRLYCPWRGSDFSGQYIKFKVNGSDYYNYANINYTSDYTTTGYNCFVIDCENLFIGRMNTRTGLRDARVANFPPDFVQGTNTVEFLLGNISSQYAKLTVQANWRRL